MIVLLSINPTAYDQLRFDVPVRILLNLPDGNPYEQVTVFFENTKTTDITQFIQRVHEFDDLNDTPLYELDLLSATSSKMLDNWYGDVLDITMSPSVDAMKGQLLAQDVLPEHVATVLDDSDACLCCELSDAIHDVLTQVEGGEYLHCPTCGAVIKQPRFVMQAVMEANYYDPKHHIGMYPMLECPNEDCGAYIALIPTEIEYNANHDVCYTGGARYMAQSFTPESAEAEIQGIFEKYLWPDIKQFVERKLNPDPGKFEFIDRSLTIDDNLRLWTQRDFSRAMCEYWYKHGLKE